ncbi:MAG: HYR domain-containing protein [Bacteroidota bacterium]|nr:HYR domain-containing protein [Bacteroidota bacterium]
MKTSTNNFKLRSFVPFFYLVVIFLLSSLQVFASHFRGGTLTWQQAGGRNIMFNVSSSWRLSYYKAPNLYPSLTVGSIITLQGGSSNEFLNFGDGSQVVLNATVVSVDAVNDIVNTTFTILHTYTSAGNFNANALNDAARITTTDGNNGNYNLQTIVNVVNAPPFNNPPVSSLPSVVNLSINNPSATFTIPGTDPDGDNVTFRLSTATESGLATPSPVGFSLSPAGVAIFNTTGKIAGTLYAVQAMVLDGKSKTPVDFIIKMVPFADPPNFITPPTPPQNTVFSVLPGNNVSFQIAAHDPAATNSVTLNPVSVPVGSTMTPALPISSSTGGNASSTFNWTPTSAQVGTNVITFVAQNSVGVQANRSITINVLCALSAVISNNTPATCPLASDGVASITVSDYSNLPNLSYRWTGPNSFTSTNQNLTNVPPGTYSLKVNDNGTGCFTNISVSILSNDVIVPVVPVLADVTGECSATASVPTTTDNCAGTVTGTTTDPLTYTTQGTHVIHWSFNDGNGNGSTATQKVIVKDVTAPTIVCNNNMVVNPTSASGAIVTYSPPVVYDNCSVASVTRTGLASGSIFPIGISTINYIITDASGNTANCSFTITVKDPYCDPDKKNSKVNVCHNGNTLCISINALKTHLDHGDQLGDCSWYTAPYITKSTSTSAQSFTKDNVLDRIESDVQVKVSPNPTRGQFILQLSNFKASKAEIKIFDQSGRGIESRSTQLVNGKQTLNFNMSNAASAIYLVKVITVDGVKIVKVAIQR